MPKTKKSDTESESSYDSDSGPDDKGPPPPSKKSKGESAKAAENKSKGEPAEAEAKSKSEPAKKDSANNATGPWILEGLRQVRINDFRGRKSVDIREHYNKNGEILPGKKGISLSLTQWLALLENADAITAAVRDQ